AQRRQFAWREVPIVASRERVVLDRTDPDAAQPYDRVADGLEHPPDLMLASLVQRDLNRRLRPAGCRRPRLGTLYACRRGSTSVEHDAAGQPIDRGHVGNAADPRF